MKEAVTIQKDELVRLQEAEKILMLGIKTTTIRDPSERLDKMVEYHMEAMAWAKRHYVSLGNG